MAVVVSWPSSYLGRAPRAPRRSPTKPGTKVRSHGLALGAGQTGRITAEHFMLVCSSGVLVVESGLRLRTVGFGRRAVLDGRPGFAAAVEEAFFIVRFPVKRPLS